jgi:hypothetical protein
MNHFFLHAQQKHFIYVQSEDKQPFAVVLGGKVYSSSDYGYVIIPKLSDSTYNFTVSFPMNKFPDQAFTCSINKKDAGYLLKNGDAGWALQNMQTQKIISNNTNATAQKNSFGDMLSDVVSDSDLVKKNTVSQTLDSTAGNTAAALAVVSPVAISAANNADITTESIARPEKISETKLDTGTNMLFVDKTQNGVDTINIFVPAETANSDIATEQKSLSENSANSLQNETVLPAVIPQNNSDSASQNNIVSSQENTEANDNKNTEVFADTTAHAVSNPFYKPEQNNNNQGLNSNAKIENETVAVTASKAVKEDCGNMITDEELNKLKRKMFVQKNDNDMIHYAVKYMNKKCITTDQVKSLGNLFSSDDGRYSLYDALYNYAYDYGNYPLLSSQILDPYYKKRFAALLR